MGVPKFDVGVADTQANEVVGAPMVGWCSTPTVASEMNWRNGGMPFANSAKYYVSACAKDHKEKGIWIGVGRRASATSESGAQWWRWAGCSHSPVLSWGLVGGLKRVCGGWIGGV